MINTMAPSTRSLTSLPDELLEMIISNLARSDLKNLRATCHNFDNLCTEPLFNEITLLPVQGCLEGFAAILKTSPHLASHVHSLVYDELWSFYLKKLGVSEVIFGLKTNTEAEIALLKPVFQLLPNLSHVAVYGIGESRQYFARTGPFCPPQYVQRFLGSHVPTRRRETQPAVADSFRSASTALFAAMAGESSALTQFLGTGFDPRLLMKPEGVLPLSIPTEVRGLAHGLKNLNVSFNYELSILENFPESFANFVGAAPNLQSLFLEFNGPFDVLALLFEGLDEDPTKVMHCLNKSNVTLKSLKEFAIDTAMCRQKDLEAFLFRHAKTLHSLRIRNLGLLRTEEVFPCSVRMLKRLRDLDLDSFVITGELHNSGKQGLDFSGNSVDVFGEEASQGALATATSSWVTGKTDAMPEILNLVAIQQGKEDFEKPDMTESQLKECGLWDFVPHIQNAHAFDGMTQDEIHQWMEDQLTQLSQVMSQFGLPGHAEENLPSQVMSQPGLPEHPEPSEDEDDWEDCSDMDPDSDADSDGEEYHDALTTQT